MYCVWFYIGFEHVVKLSSVNINVFHTHSLGLKTVLVLVFMLF